MANSIAKTAQYIAKMAGVGFYNNSILCPMVDTQYSNEYGTKSGGAQVGNSIRVRFPAQFVATSDNVISDSTLQGIVEQKKTLTLDSQASIFAPVSTEEATFELEQGGSEYSERVLIPMGKALAEKVESEGFKELGLFAQNAIVLETPFADGDVLRKAFSKANVLINQQQAPAGDRYVMVTSEVEDAVANSQLTFFHSGPELTYGYKEGKMKRYFGMDWGSSELIYTRTNGAGGTSGLSVSTYVEGAETITISDATGFVVGDKIEFTSTNKVNLQTKASLGSNLQRAVKAIAGNILTIDPIYSSASEGQQNASNLPTSGDSITVLGTAGESYIVCPVFQKKALTLASADQYLPKNQEMSAKNKINNIATRFVRGFDITNNRLLSRYETLYTFDLLRPEWATAVELKIS